MASSSSGEWDEKRVGEALEARAAAVAAAAELLRALATQVLSGRAYAALPKPL